MPIDTLSKATRLLPLLWALIGITLLLLYAILKTLGPAWELFEYKFTAVELVLLCIWVAAITYSEGYYGFQKRFVPRVINRMLRIYARRWSPWDILSPLECLGYIRVSKQEMLRSYGLTAGLVVLVVGVGSLGQPLHGIIDAGVVVGLSYGLVSLYVQVCQVLAIQFSSFQGANDANS